ncbi:MAG: DALR anticodon-binding domain-containing protein, partial [Bryobacteraceae bacterium]
TLQEFSRVLTPDVLAACFNSEELWQVVLLASKSDSVVERAIGSGEPAHVAKYAFQLAQAFNNFYHGHPVINEQNEERRSALLWLTQYVHKQLLTTLDVLGISQPEYM